MTLPGNATYNPKYECLYQFISQYLIDGNEWNEKRNPKHEREGNNDIA